MVAPCWLVGLRRLPSRGYMWRFVLRRLVQFPLILLTIYLATFTLAWIVPGDPLDRTERVLSEQTRQRLRKELHAEHWYTFLAYYPVNLITRGDFGRSLYYDEWTVNDILRSGLPVSVTLGLAALSIAVLGGVSLGAMAALSRGGAMDGLSLLLALVGISLPGFVSASLLLIGFSIKLHWFPVGGWGGWWRLALPALALSLAPMAYIARLTRVSLLEVLGADFVRTAKAKGLGRWSILWNHCLRNALLPVLSYLGPAAAATLTGSFVVERVFNLPGLGQHFVNSVNNRDQTLILGTVMVYSVILISLNLLVDVAYAWVDPRIDVAGEGI